MTDPAVHHTSANHGVADYETMPIEHVRKELHDAGIDPGPTITAVKTLIAEALQHRRRERRSVHALLARLVALIAALIASIFPTPHQP